MKPRFSILSLLLGTAVVGIGIVAATSALQLRRNKQEAFTLRQRIEQLEAASSRRRAKIESEFVGAHPHPIVIIDPRVPKANPWIFRLVNSKYRGAGGTYWVGPPGQQDSHKRRIKFEIRLLRSLDNIDYYRLAHVVGDPSARVGLVRPDRRVGLGARAGFGRGTTPPSGPLRRGGGHRGRAGEALPDPDLQLNQGATSRLRRPYDGPSPARASVVLGHRAGRPGRGAPGIPP